MSGAPPVARLLCVTAGRGPAECALAVPLALREMAREASDAGLDFGVEAGDRASALVCVGGPKADAFVKSWLGPILWVARSPLRPNHDRKNWFLCVHELEAPSAAAPLRAADLRVETLRAGGPGGQHQNRTESAVRVTHRPTGASVIARDERSQHRNRALALRRLEALLAARDELDRRRTLDRGWRARIEVTRGAARRVYEGAEFRRRE
jgi:peptide chain release factor